MSIERMRKENAKAEHSTTKAFSAYFTALVTCKTLLLLLLEPISHCLRGVVRGEATIRGQAKTEPVQGLHSRHPELRCPEGRLPWFSRLSATHAAFLGRCSSLLDSILSKQRRALRVTSARDFVVLSTSLATSSTARPPGRRTFAIRLAKSVFSWTLTPVCAGLASGSSPTHHFSRLQGK